MLLHAVHSVSPDVVHELYPNGSRQHAIQDDNCQSHLYFTFTHKYYRWYLCSFYSYRKPDFSRDLGVI